MKIICRKSFFLELALVIGIVHASVCLCPWSEASAYDDGECLVCHKNYGRTPQAAPEEVSRLAIDQDLWRNDVHYEVVGLMCDDCHADATPGTHPPGGLQKVDCAECHAGEAENYHKTTHFTVTTVGERKNADCADCHTPHAILSRDEHEAAFDEGIRKQCLSCHQERESTTVGNLLGFRVKAHRKSDISERFDPGNCVRCHFATAVGHGDNGLRENYCGRCHTPGGKAEEYLFGPFHLSASFKNQPVVFSVEVLNLLILLAVFAGVLFLVVRGTVKRIAGNRTKQTGG